MIEIPEFVPLLSWHVTEHTLNNYKNTTALNLQVWDLTELEIKDQAKLVSSNDTDYQIEKTNWRDVLEIQQTIRRINCKR